MSLSERELAERSGVTPGTVRRLVDLGVLDPRDAEGRFELEDVHRVRLMEAFEAAGVDLRAIARGIAAGEVSYENLGLFLSEPVALSKPYAELADETGRSPELLRRLVGEFGLPQSPEEPRLREDDARVLADLSAVWAEADDEELARLARTYGESLRRLVVSDLQLANTAIFSRVRSRDVDEVRRRGAEMGTQVNALAERLLVWLRRRHLEHEILSFIVQTTEDYLQERGIAPRRPRRAPAIAFLDLTGYAALTEERGDEAAAELAGRLAALVHEAAQSHGGHSVKWLGDGVMFYFPDPGAAVSSALDLVEQTPAATDVQARVGVNAGQVIAREGDYFGSTVNVAARIADVARPGEVVVSAEVRERASPEGVEFHPLGPVLLKGLKDELTLYSATRAG
jgi:adenylate cyclase